MQQCVYLKNNFCMFAASPTCPGGKKCRTMTLQKTKCYRVIYPSAPEATRRMREPSKILCANHELVCDMWYKQNKSYLAIAYELDVPAHYVRNYIDKFLRGHEYYELY